MKGVEMEELKLEYRTFLNSKELHPLRVFGRQIGVYRPTDKRKTVLVEEIIEILTGERAPIVRNNRGAPVKSGDFEYEISEGIETIRKRYFKEDSIEEKDKKKPNDFVEELEKFAQKHDFKIEGGSSDSWAQEQEANGKGIPLTYTGQLLCHNDLWFLFPTDYKSLQRKVILSDVFVKKFNLREGDIVSCFLEKGKNVYVAREIRTVNGINPRLLKRNDFEDLDACIPFKRITFYDNKNAFGLTQKYFQWLLPVGMGQRVLIRSVPKAGKSNLLFELAQTAQTLNPDLIVLVLLTAQSPEVIAQYKRVVREGNLVFTTYDDDTEKQVMVANYLLMRAKRLAECGKDVCLVVDSFNALARAYNDTKESEGGKTLVGGMESKTIHYLKKYLSTARASMNGGSITMLGSVSLGTGNPADDLIASELSEVSNLEVQLSNELAVKRIYPSIDLIKSRIQYGGALLRLEEEAFFNEICSTILPQKGEDYFREQLDKVSSYADLIRVLKR